MIIFNLGLVHAQDQNVVQGLNAKLHQAQSDSAKCEIYGQFVKLFIYSDIKKTKLYNDSLSRLAHAIESEKWIWESMLYAGTINRFAGQYLAADSIFQDLLRLATAQNNSRRLLQSYFQLAAVNQKLSRADQSLNYLQQAAELAENGEYPPAILSKIYNGIGTAHSQMENYPEAAKYIKQAIAIDREMGNTSDLMIACNSLGLLYVRTDSSEQAVKYFKESLELATAQNNLTIMSMQFRNIGLVASKRDDYKTAKFNYLQALQIREQVGDPLRVLGSHFDLAELYTSNNEFVKGEKHYKDALKLADEIASIDSKVNILSGLAALYEQQGSFKKALEFTRQKDVLLDSMSLIDVQKRMLELETQYETAKKDVQLKEQKLEIIKQTNQRRMFIGLIIFLSILAISILTFMRHRIKTKQLVTQQATELQRQRIAQLEKEKQILNMTGMIEGQEAERIRIAKDLHDGLGGLLTTIKTQVSNIQRDIDQLENLKPYEKANAMIDDACNEVRRISQNLMPDILRLEGLHGAVDAIVDQIQDTHGLQVEFISQIEGLKLNEVKELFVFRIVQELTNNIIKHANAKTVKLKLLVSGGILHVQVEDDGIGFELDQPQNAKGIGLKSVASRVNYLSGKLSTESSLGKGTMTRISLPLDTRANV